MMDDPVGRDILRSRPRVNTSTLEHSALERLPVDSFGRAYLRFLNNYTLDADSRRAVTFVDDEELAYVLQRYREVHDFWHCLFELPPTVEGELALKWIEMIQTGLPMPTIAAFFGPLALPPSQIVHLSTHYIPWVLRSAPLVRDLMCIHYEELLEKPLKDVQAQLRIEPAPQS
eukprot:gnl/Spiro4/3651_TR1795_c0_g1_i3.p1 gnl/Spiro4/3651_TR1795_c0_g1~~gnl/Spiro4/3651_TR1795_c0_g1_i3.p1  ORF type:complete len:173 (-),score=32.93 gnl/Spiro4/3651_TR1795_c0_g1_i3:179-697(-)